MRGLLVTAEPVEERTVSDLLVMPGQAEEDSSLPELVTAVWGEQGN